MLPFSTDWFMTWQPNIHSSLFLNIYEYLNKTTELEEIDAIIKAYELYLEQIRAQDLEPLLSVTRAWRLVKFVDAGMLTLTTCCKCSGKFVTHTYELTQATTSAACATRRRAPARAAAACAPKKWRSPDRTGFPHFLRLDPDLSGSFFACTARPIAGIVGSRPGSSSLPGRDRHRSNAARVQGKAHRLPKRG